MTDSHNNTGRTQEILAHNTIHSGGMASVNRRTDPAIAFARGQGAPTSGTSTASSTSTTMPVRTVHHGHMILI